MATAGFSVEDVLVGVVSFAGFLAVVIGALWAVYWKVIPQFNARLERTDNAMAAQFTRIERAVKEQFEKAEATVNRQFEKAEETVRTQFDKAEIARESLREDVSTRRHELANQMQVGLNEVNQRIDDVKDQYARRADVIALTDSMNKLANVVARFEGMITPLLGSLPRAP